MSRLPESDKIWCAERFMAGESVQAIADDLRVSRTTVENALRERLRFRRVLGGAGGGR